jgi:hypothetical protein
MFSHRHTFSTTSSYHKRFCKEEKNALSLVILFKTLVLGNYDLYDMKCGILGSGCKIHGSRRMKGIEEL